MRTVYYSEKASDEAFLKKYIKSVENLDYAEPDFVAFIKKKGNVKIENTLRMFFMLSATIRYEYTIHYTVRENIAVTSGYRGRLDSITNTVYVSRQYASEEAKIKLDTTNCGDATYKLALIPKGKYFEVKTASSTPINRKFVHANEKEPELKKQVPEITARGSWDNFIDSAFAELRTAVESGRVKNLPSNDYSAEIAAQKEFKAEHPSVRGGKKYEIDKTKVNATSLQDLTNVEVYYYWEQTATVNYNGKVYKYCESDDYSLIDATSVPKSKQALKQEGAFVKKTNRLIAAVAVLMVASLLIGGGYVALAFLVGDAKNAVAPWIETILSRYVSFAAAGIGLISLICSSFYLKVLSDIKLNSDVLSVTEKQKYLWRKTLGLGWGKKKFFCWLSIAAAYAFYFFLAALYLLAFVIQI